MKRGWATRIAHRAAGLRRIIAGELSTEEGGSPVADLVSQLSRTKQRLDQCLGVPGARESYSRGLGDQGARVDHPDVLRARASYLARAIRDCRYILRILKCECKFRHVDVEAVPVIQVDEWGTGWIPTLSVSATPRLPRMATSGRQRGFSWMPPAGSCRSVQVDLLLVVL